MFPLRLFVTKLTQHIGKLGQSNLRIFKENGLWAIFHEKCLNSPKLKILRGYTDYDQEILWSKTDRSKIVNLRRIDNIFFKMEVKRSRAWWSFAPSVFEVAGPHSWWALVTPKKLLNVEVKSVYMNSRSYFSLYFGWDSSDWTYERIMDDANQVCCWVGSQVSLCSILRMGIWISRTRHAN